MSFCPKCGKEISSEASYCPSCGASLKETNNLLREKIAETRHKETEATIVAVVGVMILVASFALGGVLQQRSSTWGYSNSPSGGAMFFLMLFLIGLVMAIYGAVLDIHYSRQREKLMKELQ
jgi:DNA-directed RNA polymerase subunit M/transcription elongation factor TFIIS